MNWQEIMSQGGIGLVLAYLLIKDVVTPLVRRATSDTGSKARDCSEQHTMLAERFNAEREARRAETEMITRLLEKLETTIDRMAGALEAACAEWRAQKKG